MVSSSKAKFTAELSRSIRVEVAGRNEFQLARIQCSVACERRGVAKSGVFTATHQRQADHLVPPPVLTSRQSVRNVSTETCWRILSTSRGSTRPGDSARQLAVPQATARESES